MGNIADTLYCYEAQSKGIRALRIQFVSKAEIWVLSSCYPFPEVDCMCGCDT